MNDKEKKIGDVTNRQRLVERFSKANPDFNGEDDEALYGAANDALLESDKSAEERARFNKSISENEIAPELLSGIISGKNADGSDFNLEDYLFEQHLDFFIDYLEDKDGAKQKLEERKTARQQAADEETAFNEGMEERIKAEDAALDEAIAESGYRPEQVKDLIDWIYDAEKGFVKRASRFELEKEDFLRLFKLKDYDMKMTEAEDKGYKRGKNEKIDMFKQAQGNRKRLPADISGGGGGVQEEKPKDPTMAALDRMGRF